MSNAIDKLLALLSWAWLFRLIYGFGDAISPAGIPKVHLRYDRGRCVPICGSVPAWVRTHIEQVLAEHGVSKAAIRQLKDGSFRFSRNVPAKTRQKIRNAMVSH